jgi:RNA polymerase sigma factor (sigma-70 family)
VTRPAPLPPLLTFAEEQALGRAIAAARHLRWLTLAPTPAELALLEAARAAVATLVARNEGLVRSQADRYARRGWPFGRCLAAGRIGLWWAAERIEPERGFKFSTYAVWWIRQRIRRDVGRGKDSGPIRVPMHAFKAEPVLARRARKLADLHGTAWARRGEGEFSRKEPLYATLADRRVRNPAAQAIDRLDVQAALGRLRGQHREVLTLRYLEGLTLAEVGDRWGLTRERVRQVEQQALDAARQVLGAAACLGLAAGGAPDRALATPAHRPGTAAARGYHWVKAAGAFRVRIVLGGRSISGGITADEALAARAGKAMYAAAAAGANRALIRAAGQAALGLLPRLTDRAAGLAFAHGWAGSRTGRGWPRSEQRGVVWNAKSMCWEARLRRAGKDTILLRTLDEAAAARAYAQAKQDAACGRFPGTAADSAGPRRPGRPRIGDGPTSSPAPAGARR